uniref:Uncharacterized protein n=1 Tax=Mycobacterium leprae TaxID=1769 RepID=O05754_MYCLR|nr:unknown [Mycobacterium leprae]
MPSSTTQPYSNLIIYFRYIIARLEGITGLSVILITHQYPDHIDVTRLPSLLETNPDALLYADQRATGCTVPDCARRRRVVDRRIGLSGHRWTARCDPSRHPCNMKTY